MNISRYFALAIAALQASLLSACGSEGDEDLGEPPLFPIPGCEQFDPHPCDARESDCQIRLFGIAACLRGDEPGEPPPISTVSRSDYAERLRTYYEQDPPSETPSLDHTLWLFGLILEDSYSVEALISRSLDFVWGVYFDDPAEILLIDRGVSFDQPGVNGVLVHEFTHALQDRAIGIDAFYEAYGSDADARLAAAAIVEGEAQFIQYRHDVSALGLDPAEVDLSRALQSRVFAKWQDLTEAPSALASSQTLFAYAYGARYLNHAFQTGGTRAVADVWASPPTTTHALLASESGVITPDFEPVQFDTLVAAGGVKPAYEFTLGAWGLFVLLAKHGATFVTANEGAQAWRGDRYSSYEVDDVAAAVWRIELADERIARELAALLGKSKIRTQAIGTTITLGVGDPALPLDWAFDQ